MSQYQIFILPVIALALVIYNNPFERDVTLSSRWKSRRRRRILLKRLVVVVFLLAPVITAVWPIGDLNRLAQSVMISALFLLPAFAIHWILLLKQAYKDDKQSTIRSQGQQLNKQPGLAIQTPVSPENIVTLHVKESKAGIQDQLGRATELIQSHDLDEPESSLSVEDAGVREQINNKRDQQLASNTSLITSTAQTTDLATLDTNQIQQLVTTLRTDKMRLQKLVIAQQAAIANERAAHNKTRVTTRDAMTVMRSARAAQKNAEKLARRERSERQRLEQQYHKVSQELRNAMSIIKSRKSGQMANENTPSTRNVKI